MKNTIKIYSDHIQKRIEDLENQINRNCLTLYQEYRVSLDEAYIEGVIEYENLLNEYYIKEQEVNMSLYSSVILSPRTSTLSKQNILFFSSIHTQL